MRHRVVLALVVAAVCAALPAAALGSAPLTWSSQKLIDAQSPFGSSVEMTGVSCPTSGLCVAVDDVGKVGTSTDGGATWAFARVNANNFFTGISCPSTSLCVAVDRQGNVAASTTPTVSASWTVQSIDAGHVLTGISCPSASLCVTADQSGNVLTSTNPGDGALAAWAVQSGVDVTAINAVSCVTTPSTLCVAVDAAGTMLSSTTPTTGGSWASNHADGTNGLRSISCPSPTLCVAGDQAGNVVTSTDPGDGASATWTVTHIDASNVLTSLSCASTTLCVAGDTRGNALTSTNPTGGAAAWTSKLVDPPPNPFFPLTQILGMSCVTSPSKLCVGVDLIGRVVFSSNPDGATPTWTRLIGVDGANTLVDIACPSASLCATVDNAGNAVTSTDGGANWATKAGIDGTTHRFWALGCPSASLCVAGDGAGNFVTSTNPGAGASATWTVQSGTDPGNIIHDVSCVLSPSTLCVAVDDSGNVLTSTDPTDGSSWSIEPVNDGSISLDGVSCPSISLCVAVDDAGNVLTSDDPTDAASWTTTNIDPPENCLAATCLARVSCPSTALCVTVDDLGNVFTSTDPADPTTWSGPLQVGGPGGFHDVSCPSVSLCVAVDDAGNAATSTDPTDGTDATWTLTNINGTTGLTGVSCASLSLCVAVDSQGNALVATGAQPHTLTVSVDGGAGSGTVKGSGISCKPDCSVDYVSGTAVALTATPDPGTVFAGWSGACSGTGECDVTMDSDRSVTATFIPQHTLNVTAAGSGTVTGSGISCPSTCSQHYDIGTDVTLSASPDSGSVFTGWSGACSGTGSCHLTMDADHDVTATFTEVRQLTVTPAGSGSGSVTGSGISCTPACSKAYPVGTQVTLTATPAAGSVFTGWSGACNGTGACHLSMSSPRNVTATFIAQHVLTVADDGSGSGWVNGPGISCAPTCSSTYAAGTVVSLTPTAAAGSTFAGWSGACSGTGACDVTMGSDQSVTATFTAQSRPPTTPTGPTGPVATPPKPACTLSPGGAHITGRTLSLTARCDQAGRVTVSGKVTAVRRAKKGRRAKTTRFSIPAVSARAAAGQPMTLRVKLPRAALAALRSGARVSVTFTLKATNANGSSKATAKITRLSLA